MLHTSHPRQSTDLDFLRGQQRTVEEKGSAELKEAKAALERMIKVRGWGASGRADQHLMNERGAAVKFQA